MKIAVPFANGEVFQHFGHSEAFKIYEVANGDVLPGEVLSVNGNGHDAVAAFLAEQGVNLVICGGIGGGAEAALSASGRQIAKVLNISLWSFYGRKIQIL